MKCSKCKNHFLEKDLELSHDVPKYIGGTDKDGRHYLCKKCHSVYELMCFSAMTKPLAMLVKEGMRLRAKIFAEWSFK